MKKTGSNIRFHFLVPPFYFPRRTALKLFLLLEFRKKNRKVEAINYIFCNDSYLLQLNQSYLNHDTFTDIITFELSEKSQALIADVYISVDRVRSNAKKFGVLFSAELLRVVFHGMLHLLNYHDKTDSQKKIMRKLEERCIDLFSRGTLSQD